MQRAILHLVYPIIWSDGMFNLKVEVSKSRSPEEWAAKALLQGLQEV